MTGATVKKPAIGRPSMGENAKARIFGELSMLLPKTPEYREARRKLAYELGFAEQTIDWQFKKLKAAFLAKEKGQGSDKPVPSASSTPEGAATIMRDSSNDPTKEV
jgi:hypothetical protein